MFCLITLTLIITSLWNVNFPKIYLGRFWRKNFLKIFWPVFMATCFSAPILLIYRLQDTTGCNINPSYYQNTTIYIQHLPSRLFLCLGLHFQSKFSKPGFKQKTEKLNTSEYSGGLEGGVTARFWWRHQENNVIKKIISKASF